MVRGVIFDVDGTLIDSVDLHAEAWQKALAHFGHEVSYEVVRHQIGKGGDQLMPVFLNRQQMEEYGEELERYRGELYRSEYMHRAAPFPRVRELFLRLRKDGMQIVLASSAKDEELKFYKELLNIGDLIQARTSADDAERSKPHPDIFDAAVGKLDGVKPKDSVVVGDTPYDAQAAGKIGNERLVFCAEDFRKLNFVKPDASPSTLLLPICSTTTTNPSLRESA